MAHDFDLFVIGGGSGGVRAARASAGYGARVAIAEHHRYGGTCVVRGCIPKKLLVYASQVSTAIADAAGFGWRIEGAEVDWAALIAAKDREIERLSRLYREGLEAAGAAVIAGRARLVDAHTVEVDGRRHTAAHILIATGSRPELPEVRGIELAITSNEAFHLASLGARVAIVGGGYIGVEFAGIFAGLGRRVTLLHRGEKLLRGFDEDVRDAVAAGMRGRGIQLRFGVEVTAIERGTGGLRLSVSDGSELEVDHVLYATGRVPATTDLGLDAVGVAVDWRGAVAVDEYSRTSVPHILAIGDCTHRLNLTPVAIREGQAVADTLFGGCVTPVDHVDVPSAVFGQPPAAVVGLTEAEARERYPRVDIYRSSFRPLRNTLGGRDERSMVKLVVDADSGRVLGAHMVGDDAPEIIQVMAIAVRVGATKEDLDRTTAIHPTSAEELVLMRKAATPG
jgi:glutathione reductase (NADPH)